MARWPSGHSHNPLRFPKIKKTMNRNTLALLLAVATGSAHAAADAFTDSIPAKAEGIPLAYIGKDTRAATALTLTAKPDGGDAIGYLPQDSSVHVLLADDHGNHLVRTDYGITGWAQKGEKLEAGSEAFPALETLTETFNGDTLATIHYNPQLGKKQDSYYHYDANNKAVAGKAPADAGDGAFDYHFLLETALKPGGTVWNLAWADLAVNDLGYISLSPKSDGLPAYDSTQGLPTDLTIPGNGYLYSYDDDASTHYFPVREKWRIKENGDKEAAAQPFYYLGLDSTYHSQWHEDGDKPAENRAVPAKLLDRIDGSKVVAEIAPEGKVPLILGKQTLCGYDAAPADCDDSAWLLIKTADGKSGWLKVDYRQNDAPNLEGIHGFAG